MATLTGAARVALGPDLPPFYTDDDALAAALAEAAAQVRDPLWRMPFHDPYEPMIEPGIADLDNAPSGGMAGSITAALFLRRFVRESARFAHFDIYGWQPKDAPGRPKGGVGQGARACWRRCPGCWNDWNDRPPLSARGTDRVAHDSLRGRIDRRDFTPARARIAVPLVDLCAARTGRATGSCLGHRLHVLEERGAHSLRLRRGCRRLLRLGAGPALGPDRRGHAPAFRAGQPPLSRARHEAP
jgi:hypothetical protein